MKQERNYRDIHVTARTVDLILQRINDGVYEVYRVSDNEFLGRVVHKKLTWHAFDRYGFPASDPRKSRQEALSILTIED